jgi:hypothetical protein
MKQHKSDVRDKITKWFKNFFTQKKRIVEIGGLFYPERRELFVWYRYTYNSGYDSRSDVSYTTLEEAHDFFKVAESPKLKTIIHKVNYTPDIKVSNLKDVEEVYKTNRAYQ